MNAVPKPPVDADTKIAVRALNFYYGSFHALRNIALNIPTGRVTAFLADFPPGSNHKLNNWIALDQIVQLSPTDQPEKSDNRRRV